MFEMGIPEISIGEFEQRQYTVSDQLRTFPVPLDIPPAEPWSAWFGHIFTGGKETLPVAPTQSAWDWFTGLPGRFASWVGGGIGGFMGAALSPLYPLLIMVAVVGVIAFMVLGRVNR